MKAGVLIIVFLSINFHAISQIHKLVEPDNIDILPEYSGGNESWKKFLKRNLEYPKYAKKNGIQGIVYIEVEIEINGRISNTTIMKSLEKNCDNAAIDVIKKSLWAPGKIKNKAGELIPIKTKVIIPIVFKLINKSS